jgi:hypothetical protein
MPLQLRLQYLIFSLHPIIMQPTINDYAIVAVANVHFCHQAACSFDVYIVHLNVATAP